MKNILIVIFVATLLSGCVKSIDGVGHNEFQGYIIQKDKKYGLADREGNVIVNPQFDAISYYYSEGLCCVRLNNKDGFIDTKGQVVIPLEFDACGQFFEGRTWFEKDTLYGYINKSGKIIITPQFLSHSDFSEGLACVSKIIDGIERYGYIDTVGNTIIDFQYDYGHDFHEGLASVKFDEKWAVINKKGKIVVDYRDYLIGDFDQGNAIVWRVNDLDGKDYGMINRKGELVLPLEYESMEEMINVW